MSLDTPLTPEEELEYLRTQVVLRAGHLPSCGEKAEFPWDCTCDYAGFMERMGRVLALPRDAARQPAAEPRETEYRLTGKGWDEIDQRFLQWHDQLCAVKTYKRDRVECDCGLEEALRSQPAAEPAVLDAERLARAIASAGVHVDVRDPLTRTEPCNSCARGVRVIAREYARLSTETAGDER